MDRINAIAENLKQRGFEVFIADTAAAAKELALSLIPTGASSAFGGSVTVCDTLKLPHALKDRGDTVYYRSFFPDEQRMQVMLNAFTADWFVMSANALTYDGEIVNTDGLANRISAQVFGSKNTLFVIGNNKFVEGLPEAFDRIKNVAAVKNCQRLGIPAEDVDSICLATTILHHPTRLKKMFVILVNQPLGY